MPVARMHCPCAASHRTALARADIVGDGLCIINGSVLRGCGLQVMAAKVVIFAYYVVAIPVAYFLGFQTGMHINRDIMCTNR